MISRFLNKFILLGLTLTMHLCVDATAPLNLQYEKIGYADDNGSCVVIKLILPKECPQNGSFKLSVDRDMAYKETRVENPYNLITWHDGVLYPRFDHPEDSFGNTTPFLLVIPDCSPGEAIYCKLFNDLGRDFQASLEFVPLYPMEAKDENGHRLSLRCASSYSGNVPYFYCKGEGFKPREELRLYIDHSYSERTMIDAYADQDGRLKIQLPRFCGTEEYFSVWAIGEDTSLRCFYDYPHHCPSEPCDD